MASCQKRGQNLRVYPDVMFTSLPIRAGPDKCPWLLQCHLGWMPIVLFPSQMLVGFSTSVKGYKTKKTSAIITQKCAKPRADPVGCWEVCTCGFFYNTSDDDKMMSHPSLITGAEDKKFSRATHICYCGGVSDACLGAETEKSHEWNLKEITKYVSHDHKTKLVVQIWHGTTWNNLSFKWKKTGSIGEHNLQNKILLISSKLSHENSSSDRFCPCTATPREERLHKQSHSLKM